MVKMVALGVVLSIPDANQINYVDKLRNRLERQAPPEGLEKRFKCGDV